jgi:hypothetical protein
MFRGRQRAVIIIMVLVARGVQVESSDDEVAKSSFWVAFSWG